MNLRLDDDALNDLQHRRMLTAAYSRYSRNAAGLGSVVGGAFCLTAFFLNAAVPLPLAARLALAAGPLVWIAAKELLRRRFYQRFGVVEEKWTTGERMLRRLLNGFIALFSIGVTGEALWLTHFSPSMPVIGYLAFIVAMPFLSWRYLHSIEEWNIGILLLCQAALVLGGSHYGTLFLVLAAIWSLAAIAVGLHQHKQFRRIAGQLSALEPLS
jgi:hypothetical protein